MARVSQGYVDPPKSKMRFGGEPALGLAISMREGGNIIDLGTSVREAVDRILPHLPIGIDLRFVQYQAGIVDTKIDDFVGNLYQAVGIVAVVMLVFLGLRTGLVVASLIPMAHGVGPWPSWGPSTSGSTRCPSRP